MPDLPPVGSLCRHRETGERRFVMGSEMSPFTHKPRPVKVAVLKPSGETYMTMMELTDWLAWAAGAERIDRETT